MPISGWVTFGVVVVLVGASGLMLSLIPDSDVHKGFIIAGTIMVCLIILNCMQWYYKNTASGRRKAIDEKSNLSNGIERTVNVYTADGEIMATYKGKIDIQESDGGYVKFDYNGKRYIYYNCFVETIAEIK